MPMPSPTLCSPSLPTVESHYGALFEKLPPLPEAAPSIVLPSDEGDPAALAALEKLGFRNPRAGHRRGPRLAVRPLPRDAQRAARASA